MGWMSLKGLMGLLITIMIFDDSMMGKFIFYSKIIFEPFYRIKKERSKMKKALHQCQRKRNSIWISLKILHTSQLARSHQHNSINQIDLGFT